MTGPVGGVLGIVLALALSSSALAQDQAGGIPPPLARALQPMIERSGPAERTIVTRHRAIVNGRPLAYRAVVTETTLAGPDGKPAAIATTYAYLVDQPLGAPKRPVVFVFNGGPGASSIQLHLRGIGPRRLRAGRIEENAASPIDVADLVFIDPVGTGASMPIRGGDARGFFGVEGDVRATIEIIARWKAANGRADAPTLLMGESYGTFRAVHVMAEDSREHRLNTRGIVLLSTVTGDTGQDVTFPITLLPTLAAVAWYHHRVDRAGRTVGEQFAAALNFAQTDYAHALLQGTSLPTAERARIAGRMSALIGIPAATLAQGGLVIDQNAFMTTLVGDGRRTGKLDARITRAISDSRFQPPYDDPSMTLGTEPADLVARYLHDELGFAPPSPYRSLNMDINRRWDWGDGFHGWFDMASPLAIALKADPALRVMSMGGYYDITTPADAGRFALDHSAVPPASRVEHLYPTGHSVFEDDAVVAQAGDDLREFILDAAR